ncbi:low molecular weight protein-tyrosine-phosphatase [Vibrio mimicus]
MGNICRSPTAEAVLRAKAGQLNVEVEIDSAGTIGYHQGNPPDARSRVAGEKRGYSFSGIKARKIRDEDFAEFDWILAADKENLAELKARCPKPYQHKLSLMLNKLSLMLSHCDSDYEEIPDPYYGGEHGFERVLDLVEEAAEQFLLKLKQQGQH